MNRRDFFEYKRSIVVLVLMVLFVGGVAAQVPVDGTFTYQGQLLTAGSPANGSYDLDFGLYDDEVSGTLLGTVTKLGEPVSDGIVNVELDFGTAPFNGQKRWLEIAVRPAGGGAFETLTPRVPLTATPYATHALSANEAAMAAQATQAGDADQLDGLNSTDFLLRTGGTVSGNLTVTGDTASGRLCFSGECRDAWPPDAVDLVSNQTIDGTKTFLDRIPANGGITSLRDVRVGNAAEAALVEIHTSWNAIELFRIGGQQFGEIRTNDANDFVLQPFNGKLRTQSDLYLQNVEGASWRDLHAGTVELHDKLDFRDSSGQRIGMFGLKTNDVYFKVDLDGDFEVRTRLHVTGNSADQYLTFGPTNATYIIFRQGPSSSRDLDVHMGTGDDGTFRILGDLTVIGNLSKSSGSFCIDHPLDPENKYLYHSFVESPDMLNIYNGNVVTDARGEAVVELPEYFEALNRGYRYQLTPIGVFAQAIVAEEVRNNRFAVKTDRPYVKVSWQVTGIRQDAWAENHRLVPEVEKPPHERGKRLYQPSSENP
ncbi:MAG: hypothetical protein GY856_25420 [bacterium]|nr:hypothetical protein [bacterium]